MKASCHCEVLTASFKCFAWLRGATFTKWPSKDQGEQTPGVLWMRPDPSSDTDLV